MYKTIFLDANIFLDINDNNRISSAHSHLAVKYCLGNAINIVTSCDLITTIYYIRSRKNKKIALKQIIDINKMCQVIEFSNKEIDETCRLMLNDGDYTDLEDSIQYILAQKSGCELILTNDKNFVSKKIPTMSSEVFVKEYL